MQIRVLGLVVSAALLVRVDAATTNYVDVATKAARWIRAARVETPAGVTWLADPRDPKSSSTALYSGSPGVILFLLELHHVTGKREYLEDARKGADDLIARLAIEKDTGLYEGIAGIGFTLAETWRATNEQKYLQAARMSVRMLSERARTVGRGIQWNDTTDVISGGAGTGLFLIYAATVLHEESARGLAISAGDRLIELAVSDQGGSKWAMDPTFPRLMPNFSHGTAGVAYYLATLYKETHEQRYLDAALAGGHYLQAIANTDGDVCLIPHDQPDGLKLYYLGWCHGPAGTARLFYRLWQVTHDDVWMDWVNRSAGAILASGIPEQRTPGFWNNVSQCCGSAGVAQFFLDLYRVTHDARYLEFSRRVTRDLLSRAATDRHGTRWVQAENRIQPDVLVAQTGYMQGAAGIGMWLLRLDAAERGRDTTIDFPDSPWDR
jgi:lantibiotic modifying enzyme